VVGGIGSILDGIYRDEMMVAALRSSVEMQGHDYIDPEERIPLI
jgi:hypothetical protein